MDFDWILPSTKVNLKKLPHGQIYFGNKSDLLGLTLRTNTHVEDF